MAMVNVEEMYAPLTGLDCLGPDHVSQLPREEWEVVKGVVGHCWSFSCRMTFDDDNGGRSGKFYDKQGCTSRRLITRGAVR